MLAILSKARRSTNALPGGIVYVKAIAGSAATTQEWPPASDLHPNAAARAREAPCYALADRMLDLASAHGVLTSLSPWNTRRLELIRYVLLGKCHFPVARAGWLASLTRTAWLTRSLPLYQPQHPTIPDYPK